MPEQDAPIIKRPKTFGFAAPVGATPQTLQSVKEELGIPDVITPAAELVDTTFIIRSAKSFESSFQEGAHAFFCTCAYPETGEVFSTVLGGQAVVDILDAYVASGADNPLSVTLRKNEGGRYGRYYTLE